MRTLLFLAMLASPTWALDTSPEGFFPSWGGAVGGSLSLTGAADTMRCWTLPARIGFSNITRVAASVPTNTNAADCILGIAIYDEPGTTRLMQFTKSCTNPGLKTLIVPAFTLVQGVKYRLCSCANHGNVVVLSIFENSAAAKSKVAERNASGVITQGMGTPCTAGVPPPTTGTLTPAQTFSPPILRLEQ